MLSLRAKGIKTVTQNISSDLIAHHPIIPGVGGDIDGGDVGGAMSRVVNTKEKR